MISTLIFKEPERACGIRRCSAAESIAPSGSMLYVFDTHTRQLFPDGEGNPSLVLPPGEESKTMAQVEKILKEAVDRGLGRESVIAGVGGGVVCDMAGLAASLYMRGCRLVLVPTSLLAMVDAAVGGKTGVDFGGYKNLAGSFYPAGEVRICPDLLSSLPEDEYINGLAEVIKYALLGEERLLELFEKRRKDILSREPGILEEIIVASVRMKVRYIELDPLERGVRAHLNLGHTFGHALEASGRFTGWTHGKAVAWGIVKALQLGQALGMTPGSYAGDVQALMEAYGFTTHVDMSSSLREELIEAMRHDKKNRTDRLTFVLQTGPGETLVREVDESAVREILS